MLIFVDESGDAGLKLGKGSSEIFVVTLVLFDKPDQAIFAEEEIRKIRESWKTHPSFEFKFNKLNSTRRKKFLEQVANLEFSYHSVVIDKQRLDNTGFTQPESFYKFACSLAFESVRNLLKESIVVIDGSGSREFRLGLQNYLKAKINTDEDLGRCIAKVKVNDSSKNELLQLADMVCGALARSYKVKSDSTDYINLIKRREGTVEMWPK